MIERPLTRLGQLGGGLGETRAEMRGLTPPTVSQPGYNTGQPPTPSGQPDTMSGGTFTIGASYYF